MARPDGRAFRALWARIRRAAAHSGGPRPARPASASLRPRSGRGPSGGPHGPGLGQPSPHAAPRLGAADGKARGRGLPSAPSGRVPPAPCGLRAAAPARPGRLWRRPPRPPAAVGELWRLVAAFGGSGLRPYGACQPPAVARGHPVGPQGQAPFGGRFAGLAPRQPRAGCGVGAPGRPAPTRGGFGAVRPSGPGGPGLGQPPGVAAPPRCGVPPPSRGAASAPSGRGPCAAAIFTPRVRALPALRVAALVRASRGWGAGLRRLRAGRPHRSTSGKAKTSRLRRALPDDLRRGKGGQGDAAPCGRSPTHQSPKRKDTTL